MPLWGGAVTRYSYLQLQHRTPHADPRTRLGARLCGSMSRRGPDMALRSASAFGGASAVKLILSH